jgi:hypothetical protein
MVENAWQRSQTKLLFPLLSKRPQALLFGHLTLALRLGIHVYEVNCQAIYFAKVPSMHLLESPQSLPPLVPPLEEFLPTERCMRQPTQCFSMLRTLPNRVISLLWTFTQCRTSQPWLDWPQCSRTHHTLQICPPPGSMSTAHR